MEVDQLDEVVTPGAGASKRRRGVHHQAVEADDAEVSGKQGTTASRGGLRFGKKVRMSLPMKPHERHPPIPWPSLHALASYRGSQDSPVLLLKSHPHLKYNPI